MQAFLEYVVKGLVQNPDAVTITPVEREGTTVYELRLDPQDVGKIIGRELEILGSHGMQAHRYPEMLGMIRDGRLDPQKLIGKVISLDEAPKELMDLHNFSGVGVTVIDRF